MKVLILVALLAVGTEGSFFGSMGNFFTGVGNTLVHTFGGVLNDLKNPINNIASQIITNMTNSGKQLVNEALQSLVLNSVNNINAGKPHSGKRFVSDSISQVTSLYKKVIHSLEAQEIVLKALFKDTISKVTDAVKPKVSPKAVKKTVSSLVSDFKKKSKLSVQTMTKEIESILKRGVESKDELPRVQVAAMKLKDGYQKMVGDLYKIVEEHAKLVIQHVTQNARN